MTFFKAFFLRKKGFLVGRICEATGSKF